MSVFLAGRGRSASDALGALPEDTTVVGKSRREMFLDVVLAETGAVAGALVARVRRSGRVGAAPNDEAFSAGPPEVAFVPASAVILATGGIDSLFPGAPTPFATGDGHAAAHRVGCELAVRAATAGIASDENGATSVPGLFAAGSASARRVPGSRAAHAAAAYAALPTPAPGPYAIMPNIDAPLPTGFADLKLARLQALLGGWRDEGADARETIVALHRLKGEADDFARARVDVELLSLKNACEIALLLLRSDPDRAR